MSLPEPVPGLVIQYEFLWPDEAARGQSSGRKDRPCVVVVAVQNVHGKRVVTVAPITHSPPRHPDAAIEIPAATKARLNLDDGRSWIMAAELNSFVWPGVDLRPIRRGSAAFAHGLLPHNLFEKLRLRVLAIAKAGQARIATRD